MSKELWRILTIIIIASLIVIVITRMNTAIAYAIEVPQPAYPSNFSNTTPVTDPPLGVPSFSWSGVSGATKYRLQVDSEIGFNRQIVVNITTKNTFYTPASTGYLLADGEWHWRVRIEEPAPVGEWSEIMTFTKSWATDENKPTLLTPDENASLAFFNARDFSWTPVIGAAKYRFQIAPSPDGFSSPVLSDDSLITTVQPEGRLENGEYWWRVIPMDIVDHLGTSSEIRNFTMAYGTYAMDLVPTLLEPKDEKFPTLPPTFHWTAVEGAENYRLEYTSDETCDFSVGTSIETRQTSYTPVDTFPNDVGYCWR